MILFIDDEARHMRSHLDELELSDFDVEFKQSVDEALDFFEDNFAQIELIILDIMMPPGNRFKNIDSGLRTGVHIYDKIRPAAPDLPIIILTNVSEEELAKRFHGEKNCWFMRKEEYLPFELLSEIENILTPNSD